MQEVFPNMSIHLHRSRRYDVFINIVDIYSCFLTIFRCSVRSGDPRAVFVTLMCRRRRQNTDRNHQQKTCSKKVPRLQQCHEKSWGISPLKTGGHSPLKSDGKKVNPSPRN
uniref:Uncharacterized protein n=1 Tax=Cacopsylla melanoneura TaxID=428564 RepID=A0A8D8ZAR3_9HEMI